MNKATATKVLEEIKGQYPEWDFTDGPNLRDSNHEELSDGSWSIDWEMGPENWAYRFRTAVPGVFVEPIFSFTLGVFED